MLYRADKLLDALEFHVDQRAVLAAFDKGVAAAKELLFPHRNADYNAVLAVLEAYLSEWP